MLPQHIVTGRQWVFVLWVRFGGSGWDEAGLGGGGGSMEISLRRGAKGLYRGGRDAGRREGCAWCVRRGNDGRHTGGSGAGGLN